MRNCVCPKLLSLPFNRSFAFNKKKKRKKKSIYIYVLMFGSLSWSYFATQWNKIFHSSSYMYSSRSFALILLKMIEIRMHVFRNANRGHKFMALRQLNYRLHFSFAIINLHLYNRFSKSFTRKTWNWSWNEIETGSVQWMPFVKLNEKGEDRGRPFTMAFPFLFHFVHLFSFHCRLFCSFLVRSIRLIWAIHRKRKTNKWNNDSD